MTSQLLQGVRVLDLTRVLSGPHCTRVLADLGADVVKVEGPDGDPSRYWGPRIGGIAAYFAQQNAGKRSVSIDMRIDRGRTLCRQLADHADVVVENFRPGVMERLGLGWADLAPENPRLVYGSITGYGHSGPRAVRKAYANMVAAQAGVLARPALGFDTPPRSLPFNVADSCAGLELVSGILGALYHRERTGRGQRVDVSMLHTMLSVDDMVAISLWDPDAAYPDTGQVITASDGSVAVSPPGRYVAAFAEVMDRPDLLEDPRFQVQRQAQRHTLELRIEVERWSSTQPAAEIVDRLSALGVACEEVVSTADALERIRGEVSGVLSDDDVVDGTRSPVITTPINFSATPARAGPAVPRGHHNHDVLSDWLDDDVDPRALEACGALLDVRAEGGPHRPPLGAAR